MKRIVITGAAGGIGKYLRKTLKGKYTLALSDIVAVDDLGGDETFTRADVCDLDAMTALVDGADGIVHLGGISKEDAFEPILNVNINGTYNVYEAARRQGVERVIFASSNHAVGFYRRDEVIDTGVTMRPDSRYGVSKAFGEALASLYADKYGVKSLCLRIGNVAEAPVDVRRLAIWISPRDLTQLIEIGLEHPALHFEIAYGMSDNARAWWNNANAKRLGYVPQDRSEDYAEDILRNAAAADPNAVPEQVQGGDFAVVEQGGGVPAMKGQA